MKHTQPNTLVRRAGTGTARRLPAGFTLTEMLVVVVIVLTVAAIAIPSFRSGLASAERSLAENRFTSAMTVARDLAIRNADGDAAAIFFYEPGVGMRIVPMVQVTRDPLPDAENSGPTFDKVARDVFAPLPGTQAFVLPPRYTIRGFAESASLGEDAGGNSTWDSVQWYGITLRNGFLRDRGQWVLPETWAFDPTQFDPGDELLSARSTFCVRFARGTGAIVMGGNDILAIDPATFRNDPESSADIRKTGLNNLGITSGTGRPGPNSWVRADLANDHVTWARNVITRYPYTSTGVADPELLRLSLIGSLSNDTVLARPVTKLALMDETVLLGGIGAARPDPDTGTVYLPYRDPRTGAQNWTAAGNTFNIGGTRVFPGGDNGQNDIVREISLWIDGDTNGDGQIVRQNPAGTATDADEPRRAKIFTFQTTRGTLMEVVQ